MEPALRRCVAALLALACVASADETAHAADAPGPTGDDAEPAPAPAHGTSGREVLDYAGRGPEPTTAGDVAAWVPRVLLSPLYFVTEYVIRRPLGAVIPAAERADVPRKVYDALTFGPEHNAGVAPVGFVAFDFNPSVGLYAFWNDAGFKGNSIHVHAEAWPSDWLAGSYTERVAVDATHAVQVRFEAVRRPDHVFYGIGPDSPQRDQSRYAQDRLDAGARYEWRFARGSRLELGSGLRASRVYDGHYGDDPSVGQAVASGRFAAPDGFDGSYTAVYDRVGLVLDSRPARASSGSGVRFDAQAEQGSDLRGSPASGWIRYRGAAGGHIDLTGYGRVLALAVTLAFADPLGERAVPFTELATLGGDGPMRGYFPGRLVDRSAAAASAHYLWPIGPWLAGSLEAAVGNVFDAHLRGFRPGRLRFSGDLGLSTSAVGDYPVEFVVGMGSETFERGGTIDSFRATVSVNHGF